MASKSFFVMLLLLLAVTAVMAVDAVTGDPRPDPEPQPPGPTESQAELINATTTTTTSTTTTEAAAAAAAATTEAAAKVEELTERTTTTTTTTTTGASVGSIDLGGGLLSNSIQGGGAAGGVLNLLGLGGSTTKKPKGPTGNFDTYLDTILNNLRKTLRTNGFDPIHLGNMLQCRNCSMEGLSLVRRAGPANLNYANRTIVVDALIGVPALYISCFPCVEVVLMVPLTGMLELALWDMQIYGKVSQKTSRGASPTLDEYRVVREGDLDMSLNAYGLLGPVAEVGFKILYQRLISQIIREFVYERVPNLIQQQLKGFSFPIGKR